MRKKIAIIGASILQKPLILKAKEMGVETHCFAWDKEKDSICKKFTDYFYPISVLEKEQILDVCKGIQIDGITSIASDFCVPTVCFIAEKMGLIGNRYEDSLIAINKLHQRQAFLKNGVHSPQFTLASEKMDLTGYRYPLIVKPTDRSGSFGVFKVEKEADLAKAILRAQELSFSKQALIEEYVTGTEVSVETISWEGRHYNLTLTDKVTTGAPYYVEIAHHEPSDLSPEIQEKVKAEARKALTAVNVNYGASDTEIMITENGEVYVIEVNARLGGDFTHEMVKLSTGYDFLKGVIDVALNQFEAPVIIENNYSGIYFLCKETEWVRQVIENKENDSDIVDAEIYDVELRNIQSSIDRSGYFIYQSDRKRRWGDFLTSKKGKPLKKNGLYINTAKVEDIMEHFNHCDEKLKQNAEQRIPLIDYSKRLIDLATLYEYWENGLLVGFAAVYENRGLENPAFLECLTIDIRKQGKGIGSNIMSLLTASLKSKKYKQIKLKVEMDNHIAMNLYKKFGFSIEEKENETRWIMKSILR